MKLVYKVAALVLLMAPSAWAAPTISTLSGTFSGNADNTGANVITLGGTSFGTKSPAAPLVWASFNGSTVPTTLSQKPGGWGGEAQYGEASTDSPLSGSGKLFSSSGWEGNIFNVAINLPGGYGTKAYVRVGRRLNFTREAANEKYLRWWSGAAGAQPDMVFFNDCKSRDFIFRTEHDINNTAYLGGCSVGYSGTFCGEGFGPPPPGQDLNWHMEQYLMQVNSANNASDGIVRIFVDSTTNVTTGRQTDTTATAGAYTNGFFSIEHDPSPGACPLPVSSNTVSFDDIYIDNSWKRIYIANSSVLSTASVTEPGIPKSWADTSVEFYFHQGRLANGSTNWIFICDGSDNDLDDCSAGKQFFVGGQGTDAGPTTLTASYVAAVGVSSFSVIWSNAGSSTYMTALSSSSNYVPTLSSGTLTARTSSYANLAQHTTYYFKVGISTEGSYSATLTTFTVSTIIPTTIGSPTSTSLTATWAPTFNITRAWSINPDLSAFESFGSATSPDVQGGLACNTVYYFGIGVTTETASNGNVYSGTTAACESAVTSKLRFKKVNMRRVRVK